MDAGPTLVLLIQRVQPNEVLLSMAGYLQQYRNLSRDTHIATSRLDFYFIVHIFKIPHAFPQPRVNWSEIESKRG